MTGTKERFEHCTSKNPFPFLFCVSPASSTAQSFFLSLLPLLIAARRIPCSFFSSPCVRLVSLLSFLCPRLSPFLRFNVVLLKSTPHTPLVSSVLTQSAPSLISSSSFSPWLCVPPRWDTRTWFLRRQRVVTDAVTKLPIKSMFNSDDCRPLTEKVEAFHL